MKVARSESVFYDMRRFHNWVKRNLLNKYATGVDRLLDLSSGKGGDLQKWIDCNIKNVMGYDIDEDSVWEASRRFSTMNNPRHCKVEFQILDLATNVIPPKETPFDVVSSMFAFHYMFATEQSFNTIMATIKNNLKIGGYFIGCLFDGVSVDNLIQDGDVFFGTDSHFRLAKKFLPKDKHNLFGRKIEVFMNETVLDRPTDEYVVDFGMLVMVLKMHGFELVETMMFSELYSTWSRNQSLSQSEKEVSFLNRFFVFRRG